MSRNTLVINCDIRETRVCLIEDGVIAELHLERTQHRGCVGNIVLGRVTRVLPGMQAAFIDIGMERAAFLHVEDLIRPDDFEAYLDKGGRPDEEPSGKGDGSRRFAGRSTDDTIDEDDLPDSKTEWDEEPDSDRTKSPGATSRIVAPLGRTAIDSAPDTEPDSPPSSRPSQGTPSEPGSSDDDPSHPSSEVQENPVEGANSSPFASATSDGQAETEDIDSDEDDEDDEELGGVVEDEELDETDEDDEEPDEDDEDDEDDGDDDGEAEDDEDDDGEAEDDEDDDGEAEDDGDDGEVEVEGAENANEDTDAGRVLGQPTASGLAGIETGDGDVTAVSTSLPSDVGESGPTTIDQTPMADHAQGSEPLPPQAAVALPQREGRGRRRRRRRRRNGTELGQNAASSPQAADTRLPQQPALSPRESGRRGSSGRDAAGRDARKASQRSRTREHGHERRGSKLSQARVSRSVPITDIVKEGNEVVVQISKEPIGTKGARVTSHISLPGRHVVYLPTVDHIGISKRIGSVKERNRLRQVIEALKPDTGGLIVRTVAEGLTKKALKTDIGYLIALWKEVSRKKTTARAPSLLYSELDLVLKTARDLFTDDVQKIIIDDREQHARLVRFVEMFLPSRVKDIELYCGDEPIFDAYGIEDEIGRALGRKVPLPSGGYLVIDQAEALTAIDVNTGRFVGKGSKDLEETALKTNLEAVNEIAYQLRLRNIGGLVILDLIDMDHASNRDKVWRSLEQYLARDKAKTTINRISDLGLIEMTRKRTRESLTRMLHEPCFYCDGTGQIQSRVTVAYEILRQVRRERHLLKGYSIVVNAHPAVVDLLQTEEKAAVAEAERRYMRRLELVPRREYHLEQFDLQGR
jgi:ribonuclease G